MARTATVALLSLLNIGTFAIPSPQQVPQSSTFQWQIYKSCSQENKDAIFRAWEDSKRFADALNSWKPKEAFQPAMDMWMGSRSTYSNLMGFDFPAQISGTARRSRGLYDGVSEYGNANLWVYCNEDSKWWAKCNNSKGDTSVVLAYEQEDRFANNWYITFCPAFYESKWNVPLDQVLKEIKEENLDPMLMENWDRIQGATFFHETMHMSQLVTSPQARDSAYGPNEVYLLARNRNTDAAVYNADSWKLTALAIFAQKELNLKGPPYPVEHPPEGLVAGNLVDIPGYAPWQVLEEVSGFVPEGADANSADPFFVDPNIWEVYGA